MQKQSTFKLLFTILFVTLIAAVCAFMLTASPVAPSASAEGSTAGSGTAHVNITVDLNGKDATEDGTLLDSPLDISAGTTNIASNNARHIRTRKLDAMAAVLEYNRVEDASKRLDATNTWHFVEGSIYNSSTAISVGYDSSSSGQYITIVPRVVTPTSYPGRFSVSVSSGVGSSAVVRQINFAVTVEDTFVQLNANYGWSSISTSDKSVLVGQSYSETNGIVPAVTGGRHDPIIVISNNSTVTIDFAEYLQNRALYCKPNSANVQDAVYSVLMTQGSSNKCWGFSSVSSFEITGIDQLAGMSNVITRVTFTNPTAAKRVTPTLVFDINITSAAIRSYLGPNSDYSGIATESERVEKFWSDTHYLKIHLKVLGNDTQYDIVLPVRFLPADPQPIAIDGSIFNLNVLSPYTYDLQNRRYMRDGSVVDTVNDPDFNSTAGYKAIIIRPSDLIEYSYPSSYGNSLCFNRDNSEQTTANYSVDTYVTESTPKIDDTRYTAMIITALRSGNFTMKFNVEYYTAPGQMSSRNIELSVIGYGQYTVTIPNIAGKKAVSYNVLSSDSPFTNLLEDNYQLVSTPRPEVIEGSEYVAVEFVNNILTITPNVDRIDGQADARLRLTFADTTGRSVTVETNLFNININAGSFWNQFEDWEAWLIIAACILGGIIIILLIVWLFIHSISKHRQEENATAAPVSSYIVKLNSTIAQQQAQQRAAATQVLSQASTQMLLGAGPTSTTAAPPPDTLQLAAGVPSQPGSEPAFSTPGSIPSTGEPVTEDLNELIARYITDDELLERIFTEKYEPKGMVRRTFFKSKDLQARELEKEKKRIIERYKTPMPMDEAIMSENEVRAAEARSAPSEPQPEEPATPEFVLDFDPDSPLYTPEPEKTPDEFGEEKIAFDISPEEAKLNDAEKHYTILEKELAELRSRLDKVQSELDKHGSLVDELREKIARAESDDAQYAKDIEDLEFKLASAKSKEKDKIQRDIKIKEEKKVRNADELEKLRAQLEALLHGGEKLTDAKTKLDSLQIVKDSEKESLESELAAARDEFEAYQKRLAQVKARQELEAKVEGLSPMLVEVNTLDFESKQNDIKIKSYEKEREDLKSEVATAKSQILGANDFDVINELNTRISDANARLSDLEKDLTKANKRKSELAIDFNAARRKANDYVEKNEIPLEDVIAAEDIVIGNIELDKLKAERGKDRDEAEQRVAVAQAEFDDMAASSGDVTMVAMEIAANIKDIEDEIAEAQAALDAINAQMETASEDEKLMLMVDQGDKTDKIEELKEKLNQANVEGTKRKMEAQSEYDGKLDEVHKALDEANVEYQAACAKYDALIDNTNPADLIVSGSGIISQDQKKFEAENYKKQLEKQKAEAEQARLAAQQAQMEAEQARIDAMRASDEAKAEAERKAQEAIEAAEAARLEAEQRARAEAEAAEAARKEAEEAAERAKREAEESAEAARKEAEEAAERAKREAEEAAEAKRKEAEEAMLAETEEAKRKAQEEIEEMRRKAEEDAEKARLDEEAKRKEEEEKAKADAERKDEIAKKIANRKEKIINLRDRMKDLKGEEDAKDLREQLYTMQLGFDEDERGSTELMDFYNKTMDDIQHAGETAKLKSELAKKPQRVVKKVTERVNRIPRKKAHPGARPGARPAARPGARPAGARPSSARPGARPPARPGARPAGARPSSARPGSRPTPPRRPKP